ncbi:MAG: hypothetical protein JKX72_04430 [Robiginitomaculum sp.]|nr:hypothetical protein [Robiginitomaculum sp.]
MTQTVKRKAPHIFWTLTEGRAIFELGWFHALRWPMQKFPKGDDHPIIVLPVF